MLSQWDCFLKNLGQWSGSFTKYSATGEEIEDTPTIVTLEGRQSNQAIHQVVRYLYPDKPPKDLVLNYTPSSIPPGILFFDNGAFSQGSLQRNNNTQFGGEFGLIEGDRRLRMVQLYNRSNRVQRIVLIREKAKDSQTPERPPLKIEDLIGEWEGEAVSIYPDSQPPHNFQTYLKVESLSENTIEQTLSFDGKEIKSIAKIEGNRLLFEQKRTQMQMILFPDGASCNCPIEIKPNRTFILEMGWLLEPEKRQRIIRNFDPKGTWVGCTSISETKVY